jgi:hypothetical protein
MRPELPARGLMRGRCLFFHDWRDWRGFRIPDIHVGGSAPSEATCAKCGKRKSLRWRMGAPW